MDCRDTQENDDRLSRLNSEWKKRNTNSKRGGGGGAVWNGLRIIAPPHRTDGRVFSTVAVAIASTTTLIPFRGSLAAMNRRTSEKYLEPFYINVNIIIDVVVTQLKSTVNFKTKYFFITFQGSSSLLFMFNYYTYVMM